MVKIPHDEEKRSMIVHALLKGLPKNDLAREKAESEIMSDDSTVWIAPWHFHPEHREFDMSTGEWRLKPVDPTKVFSDSDNKKWRGFPPPNYAPKKFLELEIEDRRGRPQDRWKIDLTGEDFPSWVQDYAKVDRKRIPAQSRTPINKTTKAVSQLRKRTAQQISVTGELDAEVTRLRQLLELEQQTNAKKGDDIVRLTLEKTELQNSQEELQIQVEKQAAEISELQNRLTRLAEDKALVYQDLAIGGRLHRFVAEYTFFDSFETNEAFLAVVNWDDDKTDDGLCVGLRRYSRVKEAERRGEEESPVETQPRVEQRALEWKTEYLLFCTYCRAGMTMGQIAPLFGLLSASTVSDVVYQWANVLDDALSLWFPTPTRSQLFRAYPAHNIRVLGDARVFMELDATEAKTQSLSDSEAHASMHSEYKSSDTVICRESAIAPQPAKAPQTTDPRALERT
jgi:hypothetical protein